MRKKNNSIELAAFLKSKPRQIKECLFKPNMLQPGGKVSEAGVLVNLKTGVYYVINRTVEKIWLAIDGKQTVERLAAKTAKAFKVGKKTVLPDVVGTIKMLEKAGLIRRR